MPQAPQPGHGLWHKRHTHASRQQRLIKDRRIRKTSWKIIMKRSLFIAALASGLPLQVFAQSTPADLARSKNCLACHSVNAKIVGPAFKDVAQKYKNQKDVEDKLAQRVLKGSSGVWGAIPMPANAQVSEAEARMLVKWVLI